VDSELNTNSSGERFLFDSSLCSWVEENERVFIGDGTVRTAILAPSVTTEAIVKFKIDQDDVYTWFGVINSSVVNISDAWIGKLKGYGFGVNSTKCLLKYAKLKIFTYR